MKGILKIKVFSEAEQKHINERLLKQKHHFHLE